MQRPHAKPQSYGGSPGSGNRCLEAIWPAIHLETAGASARVQESISLHPSSLKHLMPTYPLLRESGVDDLYGSRGESNPYTMSSDIAKGDEPFVAEEAIPPKHVSRFTRWFRSPLFNVILVGLISFTPARHLECSE